jgi:nucleotide-binding universal stress UspA family protein
MKHILVPIDPDQPVRMQAAIERVVLLYGEEPGISVHLLRVEPQVSGHVAMFFAAGELSELQQAAGAENLRSAQAQLDAAGVPYESLVRVGRSAPTIVATAQECGCDCILFGPDQPRRASRIFGSLAEQVRQMLGTAGQAQVIGY